jgi:hypothetical protein
MSIKNPAGKTMDVDIRAQVEERIRDIRKANPSMSLDYLVTDSEHGTWGAIIYIDYNFETMGFEFIESEESWQRPEAIDQYNGFSSEGYCVVIYAPSNAMDALIKMLKQKGGRPNLRLARIEEPSGHQITLRKALELTIPDV